MGERAGAVSRGREYKVTYILRPPEKFHRFGINSLALSSSGAGQCLYTAGRDSFIRKWDVTPTSCDASSSRSLEGHVDWVNDLLMINQGWSERLVSCSSDTTLRIWDPQKLECLLSVNEHTDYVKALASVNSTTVASGALDSRVCLWDLETWKVKVECGGSEGVKGSVYTLAGCPSEGNNIVAVGSTNRIVSVWDARSGEKIAKLKGHNDSVRCLSVHRDGLYILSGGSDSLVRLWDLRQQRELNWYDPHTDSVWALATPNNFQWFLSGGRDGAIFHTNIETGVSSVVVSSIATSKVNMVLSMAMAPDESAVWVSNAGSSVKLWSINTDTKLKSKDGEVLDISKIPSPPPLAVIPGLPGIMCYKIMNNRRHVLTKDSDGMVVLWDITRACSIREYGARDLEEVAKELQEEVFVPAWFSIEIRLGSVGVKLDRSCFNAEIYAVDAGLEADSTEIKVNIGEHVLRGLFRWWKASYDGERGVVDTSTRPAGYSDYILPEYIQVIISEDGSPVPILQKAIGKLTADDEEYLPNWVLEPVRDGIPMAKDPPKILFYLQPDPGSNLPKLTQSKLWAPRVLRIRKVVPWLLSNLEDNGTNGFNKLTDEADVEIVCNGRVLPSNMSLQAIRHFVWRDPGDLELTYRMKTSKDV